MPLDSSRSSALAERFLETRARTEALAAPLSPEDWMIQSMEEASPVKWHLAHTSWFFETFVLLPYKDGYRAFDPVYGYLFNSYYNLVGDMHPRPKRGMISRPSAAEVLNYRRHVTEAAAGLLEEPSPAIARLIEIGCAHEEQHQELLLQDLKHGLFQNPTRPAAYPAPRGRDGAPPPLAWTAFDGGSFEAGWNGEGFAFDNEGPRHRVHLNPFALASRLVTNGEWLEFMEAGGYSEPSIWLSDGWRTINQEGWGAPLYWRKGEHDWREFTLFGERELDLAAPAAHFSFYEAAAYAEWTGYRLPTEFEWERAARGVPVEGNFLADAAPGAPLPARGEGLAQLYGDLWEWTASPYVAYPGFRTPPGAIGEYNGKFMSSQMVLRGGSCATPAEHVRATYRNFYPPHARWAFSGLRLARDL